MNVITTRSVEPILIIEDSPDDYEAFSRGLSKAGFDNPLYHCMDGEDALDFLHQRNQYSSNQDTPKPGIILLDLNMPGVDGREVLRTIKEDPELSKIPVLVLTTSIDAKDIDYCYELGANSYIQKPVDHAGFMEAIERIGEYWFSIVMLPRNSQN